jgi:hypothetical protein
MNHENYDNNLESLCIYPHNLTRHFTPWSLPENKSSVVIRHQPGLAPQVQFELSGEEKIMAARNRPRDSLIVHHDTD